MVFEKTKNVINYYGAKSSAGFLGILSLYELIVGNYERFMIEASLSATLYKTASFYKTEKEDMDARKIKLEDKEISLKIRENDLEQREKSLNDLTVYIQSQNEILNRRELNHDINDAIARKSEKLEEQLSIMRKLLSDERDILMAIRERKQYIEDVDDSEIVELLARTSLDSYAGNKKPM